MRILRPVVLLLLLSGIFAFTYQAQTNSPVIIRGKVINETTGRPVAKVHVYILEGEEEALTNSNGEFRIESWQKTPLKLTVCDYASRNEKTSIQITDPSKEQIVRLKLKSP